MMMHGPRGKFQNVFGSIHLELERRGEPSTLLFVLTDKLFETMNLDEFSL